MWLSKIGGSYSKFIGTGISVAWELGLNLEWIPELTMIQNLELNHKIEDRVHIHVQIQFHWNENLPICQWFGIDKVKYGVMKLNLGWSFQDTMILGPYQYLINPAISKPIDLVQESCCFENQDSISLYNLELD